MNNRLERPRNVDEATIAFDRAKTELRKAVRHPILPQIVGAKLLPIISKAELLSDSDFLATISLNVAGEMNPQRNKEILLQTQNSNGFFLPKSERNPQDRILFRKSNLDKSQAARDFFTDLFAEEVAHAFSTETTRELTEIPDDSYSLYPFTSRPELVEALSSLLHEKLFGEKKKVEISDIYALQRGFETIFVHKEYGRYGEFYPQLSYEEWRASILQTIFEALIVGEREKPKATPEEQFSHGQTTLVEHAIQFPAVYFRELVALDYLNNYLPDYPLRQGIRKLVLDLSKQTFDEFMDNQNEQLQERVAQGVLIIDQSYVSNI